MIVIPMGPDYENGYLKFYVYDETTQKGTTFNEGLIIDKEDITIDEAWDRTRHCSDRPTRTTFCGKYKTSKEALEAYREEQRKIFTEKVMKKRADAIASGHPRQRLEDLDNDLRYYESNLDEVCTGYERIADSFTKAQEITDQIISLIEAKKQEAMNGLDKFYDQFVGLIKGLNKEVDAIKMSTFKEVFNAFTKRDKAMSDDMVAEKITQALLNRLSEVMEWFKREAKAAKEALEAFDAKINGKKGEQNNG